MTKAELKRMTSEVFKTSLLTGVPHVVEERNAAKKIARILILLFCIAGFSFQVYGFLHHYYSYPTVVEYNIVKTENFVFPALVFCNASPIRRSKFCEKYPERCSAPNDMTKFCRNYPHYCSENGTASDGNSTEFLIPNSIDEWFELDGIDYQELGYNLSDFLLATKQHSKEVSKKRYGFSTMDGLINICYRKYFRGYDGREPVVDATGGSHSVIWNGYPFDYFVFDFDVQDTFHPLVTPGGIFGIQSPFETRFDRIVLEPTKSYEINIELEEERLLPPPYPTDCRNYTGEWIKDVQGAPRSKEMCQQFCFEEQSKRWCNCTTEIFFLGNLFPHDDVCPNSVRDSCNERVKKNTKAVTKLLSKCTKLCKDNCIKWRFKFQVQKYDNAAPFEGNDKVASVVLNLKDLQKTVISHKPKFEGVETFSYIGGYLGLWLGFCMVACVDFLQSMLLVGFYAFRKSFNRSKRIID